MSHLPLASSAVCRSCLWLCGGPAQSPTTPEGPSPTLCLARCCSFALSTYSATTAQISVFLKLLIPLQKHRPTLQLCLLFQCLSRFVLRFCVSCGTSSLAGTSWCASRGRHSNSLCSALVGESFLSSSRVSMAACPFLVLRFGLSYEVSPLVAEPSTARQMFE